MKDDDFPKWAFKCIFALVAIFVTVMLTGFIVLVAALAKAVF